MIRVILVARKPLRKKSVAENTLGYGTGGINVDGCRIHGPTKNEHFPRKVSHIGEHPGWDRPWKHTEEGVIRRNKAKQRSAEKAQDLGRWPANLILQHKPECREIGVKKVRGHHADFADEDGNGTVDQWKCVGDCPVHQLGDQSGDRPGWKTQKHNPFNPYGGTALNSSSTTRSGVHEGFNDHGTAARFFKQVQKK